MKMTAIPFESMIIHIKHGGIIFHPCKALMHKNTILFSGHILKEHVTNRYAFITLMTRGALLLAGWRSRGRF